MLEEDKEDLTYPTVTPESQETMAPNLQMEALGVANAIAPIVQFNAPIQGPLDDFSVVPQSVTPRQIDVKRDLAQKYIKQYPDFLKAENIIQRPKVKSEVGEALEEEGFLTRQSLGIGVGAVRGGVIANALVEGYEQMRWFMTGNEKDDTFDPTRDDLVSSYESIDPRYWPTLLSQPNEAKWKAKFEAMSNENTLTQLHDSLRWWELTPGYMAGFGLDVLAAPFRMAIGAKTIGSTILKTAAVDMGKAAASAGLYEMGVQGTQLLTRDQLSLEEAALNVGVATLFGGALGAAGGMIKFNSINNFKTLMSEELNGAEVKFNVGADKKIKGFVAIDDSAGAMKVTNYDFEDFAVSGFTTKEGSNFYWNPIKPIMNTVTEGVVKSLTFFGGNPVLKGLLSDSTAMRKFTGTMLRPNFEIDAVQLHGKERPQSLDETLRSRNAKFFDIERIINDGWTRYLGIDPDGKSTVRIRASEAIKSIKHEGLSKDAYNTELTRSLSNNGESEHAIIREVSKQIIEYIAPIMQELKDTGMPLPDKPKFDQSYLNRVFDYRYMHENPEASMKSLKEGFEHNQKLAIEILKPITEQQAKVALKKQAIEDAKDESARLLLQEQLKNENLTLKLLEEDLQNKILKNEIQDTLLIGEAGMNYNELKELKSLRDPIDVLKKQIKTLEKELRITTRKAKKEILTGMAEPDILKHEQLQEEAKQKSSELKSKKLHLASLNKDYNAAINKVIQLENSISVNAKSLKRAYKKRPEISAKLIDKAELLKSDLSINQDFVSTIKDEIKIYREEVKAAASDLEKYKTSAINLEKKANKTLSIESAGLKTKENLNIKKDQLTKQLEEHKKELAAKRLEIEKRAASDTVFKERLTFQTKAGAVRLKKPNKGTRKVRPPTESIDDLIVASEKTYNTLNGLTPEQIDDAISARAQAGSGGADMMTPRVLAFSEDQLLNMKLLNPDPKVRLNGWYNRAMKHIETHKYFKRMGWDEGKGEKLDFITHGIEDDYNNMRKALIEKFVEKKKGKTPKQIERIEAKQRKESDKLLKRQTNDIKVATEIYKRILGAGPDNRSLGLVYAQTTNSHMDASFLGATSLLQMQELVTPALTKGWKNQMLGGLIPFFSNVLIPMSKGNALAKQQVNNFGKAIQMQMYFMSRDANFSGNSIPNGLKIPFTNWSLQAGVHRLNRFMQMWSLSGPIASMTETISTMSTQYAINDALRRHSKGILSKKGLAYLHQLGINPDSTIGKRIAYELKEHGLRKNGYQFSNTHLWESKEAKQVYDTAVFGDVSATIFNGPDAASWPVYLGDPRGISRFMFKYMGWGFSATSNFLIPILQATGRADFEKLSVMAAMVMLSSMIDPLRKIARGEEPDLDPMNLLWGGIINSGVLGTTTEIIGRSAYMMGVTPPSYGDRFKYSRGLISSAPETMSYEMFKLFGMAITGDTNKQDLQRGIKLIAPFLDTIWMRPAEYGVLNELDIPEKRTKSVAETIQDLF